MAKLFFSYSHQDEVLRNKLETHLSMLRRQGLIESWHDRRITAGSELDAAISEHIEAADVILLLVSSDFLASEYCYSTEMMRALERHEARKARVIPVILRPCDWHTAPFSKLLAAPRDGKAITMWPNEDEAFTDVAVKVRDAVKALGTAPAASAPRSQPAMPAPSTLRPEAATAGRPRSSNLRLTKEFSQLDVDEFLRDSFEYMAKFFEGSVNELQQRNSDIQARFERLDARRFAAHVYRNGRRLAECSICLGGGGFGRSITFSYDRSGGGGINEMMNVDNDSQSLYLKATGLQSFGQSRGEQLSHEGAAEHLWALFIAPLQR
ncbi:toll/interleukin-1 receptor domain-containing protein [Myxococcus qinghaiensis]|uniref:toll/interleukin-1 receptor domain-containing protein n=1 Tax=Myxococcus qinghaiensis TaxID=2906758 RepID=UPI0020A73216|nr:toll/interleukin-1 receptor domain-containing protein [Myxococcus qinghaiensis]MCP3167312.1 toll/interleukin-1 receptor domain-containing protein [Myxococcus qinghaiensis]